VTTNSTDARRGLRDRRRNSAAAGRARARRLKSTTLARSVWLELGRNGKQPDPAKLEQVIHGPIAAAGLRTGATRRQIRLAEENALRWRRDQKQTPLVPRLFPKRILRAIRRHASS
jgi:hypothetical protein